MHCIQHNLKYVLRRHRLYAENAVDFYLCLLSIPVQLFPLLTMNSHFCGSGNKPKELFVNTWFSQNFYNQLEQKYNRSFGKDWRGQMGNVCVFHAKLEKK